MAIFYSFDRLFEPCKQNRGHINRKSWMAATVFEITVINIEHEAKDMKKI